MIKAAIFMLGFMSLSPLVAQESPIYEVKHVVKVSGIPQGEGRFVRVDMSTNNNSKNGYYFCAENEQMVYNLQYRYTPKSEPYHAEHFLKFSVCDDETLAHCQEFATDRYVTSRKADGTLENDVSKVSIDMTPLQNTFHSCQPHPFPELDALVKQSIHADDRRFSRIG